MSKKEGERAPKETFEVSFDSGDETFGPASYDAWSRYLDKIKQGKRESGNKELVIACCLSKKFDELEPLLEQIPAGIADIADAIEEISGGEIEVETVDRFVVCDGLKFSAPSSMQWSTFQENLKEDKFRGGEASRMLLAELVDDKDAFELLLRRAPAVLGSIMIQVSKVAGRGIRIKRKKS